MLNRVSCSCNTQKLFTYFTTCLGGYLWILVKFPLSDGLLSRLVCADKSGLSCFSWTFHLSSWSRLWSVSADCLSGTYFTCGVFSFECTIESGWNVVHRRQIEPVKIWTVDVVFDVVCGSSPFYAMNHWCNGTWYVDLWWFSFLHHVQYVDMNSLSLWITEQNHGSE